MATRNIRDRAVHAQKLEVKTKKSTTYRTDETLAVVTYDSLLHCSTHGNLRFQGSEMQLTLFYFEATFWSLYHRFSHVAVIVASLFDKGVVDSMDLPLFSLTQMPVKEQKSSGESPSLPLFAWRHIISQLDKNSSWSSFKYFYVTTGDNQLHYRNVGALYDAVDAHPLMPVAPHRLLALPYTGKLPLASKQITVSMRTDSCCNVGPIKLKEAHGKREGGGSVLDFKNVSLVRFEKDVPLPLISQHMMTCQHYTSRHICF